jgi:hypothetical protein
VINNGTQQNTSALLEKTRLGEDLSVPKCTAFSYIGQSFTSVGIEVYKPKIGIVKCLTRRKFILGIIINHNNY